MHLHGVKCRIGTHPTLARVEGAVNVADLRRHADFEVEAVLRHSRGGVPHLDCHDRSAGFAPGIAGEQLDEHATRLRRVK